MPSISQRGLTDYAVRWALVGSDRHGQPTVFDLPEEIRVAWDERTTKATVEATVLSDRELVAGDVLWQGRLQDLSGTLWEDQPHTLMEVVEPQRATDLKGRSEAYTNKCTWYRGSLPNKA